MNGKHRDEFCEGQWKKYRHTPAGKVMGGVVLMAVGGVLLARQLGVDFPLWMFTWPSLLIVLGIYIGARHLFCNPGWIVLVVIGSIFLLDQTNPDIRISMYVWPLLIITAGLFMIFKPFRRRKNGLHAELDWEAVKMREENTNNDYIETLSILSGVQKNIISKNFKGGEVTCVLGGAEINLMQADFEGRVVLEVTQILGGTKLIIPAHWEVQPEMLAVMGGIEDKRQVHNGIASDKVLILKGTSVLGGIEIKSY